MCKQNNITTETHHAVCNLIADMLGVSTDVLSDQTSVGDLPQWDSLMHLSIIATIEDLFNFQIPLEQMTELDSIGKIVAVVHDNAAHIEVDTNENSPAIISENSHGENTEQVSPRTIRNLIADILGCSANQIEDSTKVGDLEQWDSLMHLTILATIEDMYGIKFPTSDVLEFESVGQIAEYVLKQSDSPTETSCQTQETEQKFVSDVEPWTSSALDTSIPDVKDSIVVSILKLAKKQPSKLAIVFNCDSLTYSQLAAGILRSASYYENKGLTAGNIIALYAERTKEFIWSYFGAHLLGIAVVLLDPEIKKNSYQYIVDKVHPLLTLGSGVGGVHYNEICLDSYEEHSSTLAPPMESIADIMFTTGTTGLPKAVKLTHLNIAVAAAQINTFIGNGEKDVEVVALPISRSFGLGRIRCVLSSGGTIVLAPGFGSPLKLFNLLKNYKATGLGMVPASWLYLFKMSGERIVDYAQTLKYIEFGSAFMPVETKLRLTKLFPNTRICMHFGLTEASRSTFMEFHSEISRLDSAGKASPGVEICIFGNDGIPLPTGEEGEICIKGNHVMQGYLDEDNDNIRYGDYFRSGDWGKLDADGYLYISGRSKDMINVGGKKVSPEEVENVLNTIPGIAESACVPMPDPQGVLGEVVKAILVSDGGGDKPTDENIKSVVASNLEQYKVPYFIVWRESLMKTDTGKIQRQLMK